MQRLAIVVTLTILAAGAGTSSAWGADGQEPLRKIVGDARFDGKTTLVLTRDVQLRMPGTTKVRAWLPDGTRLTRFTAIHVRAEGKTYEVELWTGTRPNADGEGGFGERVAVLAVFPVGAAAPTDVAEVQTDRETYLRDKLVSLGADDAFEVVNAHLNAGEDHNLVGLFHLRGGRLRRIAELRIGSQQDGSCQNTFQQRVHWRVASTGAPLPDITADVETIHAPKDLIEEACPGRKPKQWSEHVRTPYRWDRNQNRYVKAGRSATRQPR